jgi:thymidylate kinase
MIVIAGPDGAGKSRVADELCARLASEATVLRIHHRFGLLPVRGGLDAEAAAEPHRDPHYGRLRSELKVVYLFVDFVVGWTARARRLVRRGGWVLIERGWWDLVVDPQRYRLDPDTRLAGVLGRLLPEPAIVLVLEAPPDILIGRKRELPAAELRRQARAWHDAVPAKVHRTYVDASREFPAVLDDAWGAVAGAALESA